MAAEGVRRSGRVRKTVQNYADEQAAEEPKITQPKSRKRKAAKLDDDDGDNLTAPPVKRAKKKVKLEDSSSDAALSEPAKESSEAEYEAPKPAKKAAKKGRKRGDPLPLDEQVRTWPHSKIYPVPEKTKAKQKAWHGYAAETRIERTRSRITPLPPGQKETRLRPEIKYAGDEFETFMERATTQKMFVIERERSTEIDCHAHHEDCPCETLKVAGTTGNVYTVSISHLPSCTCPVGLFTKGGSEKCCKHIIYVLHNVLKAQGRLEYQNAYLTAELHELFANAPPFPSKVAEDEPKDGNRKSLDDDCPICFMELEGEENVWCRAACGNNVHKECFGHVSQPIGRTLRDT